MTATVTRKYALTKVEKGDYLLPSNDGRRVWRLRQYVDGPSGGITDWERDRTLWGCWLWTGPLNAVDINPDASDRWEFWEGNAETRAEVITIALKADPA
jgi:hypothetical protein